MNNFILKLLLEKIEIFPNMKNPLPLVGLEPTVFGLGDRRLVH